MGFASDFGLSIAVFMGAFCITFFMEHLTRPVGRGLWSRPRLVLHGLVMGGLFGWCVLISGSVWLSACVMVLGVLVGVIASNIKFSLLGEPLLFSDVVVARSFLRNPKFYLFSVPLPARVAVVAIVLLLPALFIHVACQGLHAGMRLSGALMAMGSFIGLRMIPRTRWAPVPDAQADITRLGLVGSLHLYWHRWQAEPDGRPPPPISPSTRPRRDIVVVVQCESFADPRRLGLGRDVAIPPMPGLDQARQLASAWGTLEVSGFGAYTMRTEYGVLFGRGEADLGFRYFDPFLTAGRERDFALPYRLGHAGYETVFMHPHNLGFYSRDHLMPAIGFHELVGGAAFAHAASLSMPYTPDCDVADAVLQRVDKATQPLFLYVVTMENHGPWPKGEGGGLAHYLRHLEGSDRMLDRLAKGLEATGRTATLVFFGDHRPSIPGSVEPGKERDTPFVVIDFPVARASHAAAAQALSPAELHGVIERHALETG
ncbi:LTA synthase family protein [Komagataeibacter sp. FNDCR2]|uniref:LTA synthase family protein n=1 Tax=Komagataeibacter sp. FNDCR2 TaxID=2878682 RepID=UPI001E5B5252|nr:LTA synthase family protein [Komagataeibacter sp. FNDCR2]MCE2575913.1 LTA synthase family protein [Komagataeibacter sp. FNDCR2]